MNKKDENKRDKEILTFRKLQMKEKLKKSKKKKKKKKKKKYLTAEGKYINRNKNSPIKS